MILTTTHSLRVVLAGAHTTTAPTVSAEAVDVSSTIQASSPLPYDATTSGTTPVTVVAAPSSGTRNVTRIAVFNGDSAPATVTVYRHTTGGGGASYTQARITLAAGYTAEWRPEAGWTVTDASGRMVTSTATGLADGEVTLAKLADMTGPAVLGRDTGTGPPEVLPIDDVIVVEIFSSGTLTLPSGCTGDEWVEATLYACGGPGGSGAKQPAGTIAGGGGGGGPAGAARWTGRLSALVGLTLTLGAQGTPGASRTTDATNGQNGTTGSNASLGTVLLATAGVAGNGGTSAAGGTGGNSGQPRQNNDTGGTGGVGNAVAGRNGSGMHPGGGAGGGGVNTSNTAGAAAAGGLSGAGSAGGAAGAAGSPGGDGGDGDALGSGAGGGAPATSGNAKGGDGGEGLRRGAGGGGGAGSRDGASRDSGAGGQGAAAELRLVIWPKGVTA